VVRVVCVCVVSACVRVVCACVCACVDLLVYTLLKWKVVRDAWCLEVMHRALCVCCLRVCLRVCCLRVSCLRVCCLRVCEWCV